MEEGALALLFSSLESDRDRGTPPAWVLGTEERGGPGGLGAGPGRGW